MRRAHLALVAVVGLILLTAILGIVRLTPAARPEVATADSGVRMRDGRVTAIEQGGNVDADALAPGARPVVITAVLRIGREVKVEMVDETGDTFSVGQHVRIAEAEGPDGRLTYSISDIQRERPIAILAAVFLAVVLVLGRWRGLRALIALVITLSVVAAFAVPAILAGGDPVLIAASASIAIVVVTLYVTHGIVAKTTAAVIGTLAALGITVGLSWLFIELAALTGLSSAEAALAGFELDGLPLRGLLLAGMIIGALGVLDDVTMAQSSTVFQLRAADPLAGPGEVFSRAMAEGRRQVAASVNTLFLAYAGASLPLLVLFTTSPDRPDVIVSSEAVAIELVRTLVGTIGLMASVPLTTLLAAWLARDVAPVSVALDDDADERRTRKERRRQRKAPIEVFSADESFSPGDEADSEWERRLRDSYGLNRRQAVPRRSGD